MEVCFKIGIDLSKPHRVNPNFPHLESQGCSTQLTRYMFARPIDLTYGWTNFHMPIVIQYGDHVTNDFPCTIQLQWKWYHAVIDFLVIESLQNFAHAMTAVLSWHVQKL